jgi:hypothetical protein
MVMIRLLVIWTGVNIHSYKYIINYLFSRANAIKYRLYSNKPIATGNKYIFYLQNVTRMANLHS